MNSTPVLLALCAAGLCWGQAPADCKPNPLNVPLSKAIPRVARYTSG
jgi:hypothetical protein